MDVSGAPMNYFRRGGRMAMGGDPGDDSGDQGGMVEPIPGISIPKGSGMSPIPYLPLQSGSGQFHNNLNLTPPAPQKQDSGDSGLGSIAKIAATVLPFFLARGGSVSPYDMGQGFDEGGDVDPEALAYDSGGDKGESWSPPDNSPYDTAGARAPEPHMTMSDVTKRAKEYYLGDGDQTPEAMAAEATPTQTTNTAVPDIQTDMPPYAAQSAAAAPQAGVPMPQRRPDIAGPAGQGNFSPQTPPLTPQQIAQETMFAANKYGIPQDLALRLVRRESGFRNIRGAAGEYGPTQLMPGTAREMGVSDPSNTYENIHGGMQYLKKMYDRYGNWGQAVAAYNAGPGNVDRGRIPASTQAYVKDVNGDGRVDVNDLSAKQQAEHGDTGSPYGGGSNRDMSMATEQMPRSQQPYPDSLQRDWGQNATRSPWMALVKAGAAMASSTGPIGSVIGKGIAAGAGELDNQRKELRSEEDINNKAGALYQQAKQHLNQYQRLTPYQNELIKAGKGNYQSLGKDPDTGEEVLIDRRTGQLVDTGRVLNPTQKSTALQSNIEWLKSRGIGKDDQERFQIAHSGVNNAATFGRLVQAEKKFLSGLPEGAGKSDAELETAARANVTNRGFQANPGAAGRATPTPKDIQWVKDHPETAGAFKERFGIDPPKE
jgi:hypothetical protein